MYRFYGDEYEGDEGAINLTSMAPRDENRVPKGVTVTELWEGAVDFEGGSDKKLKYDTPSMAAYDISTSPTRSWHSSPACQRCQLRLVGRVAEGEVRQVRRGLVHQARRNRATCSLQPLNAGVY